MFPWLDPQWLGRLSSLSRTNPLDGHTSSQGPHLPSIHHPPSPADFHTLPVLALVDRVSLASFCIVFDHTGSQHPWDSLPHPTCMMQSHRISRTHEKLVSERVLNHTSSPKGIKKGLLQLKVSLILETIALKVSCLLHIMAGLGHICSHF